MKNIMEQKGQPDREILFVLDRLVLSDDDTEKTFPEMLK